MRVLPHLLWCLTLLLLAWLAHRASVEIILVHRLDLDPLLRRVESRPPDAAPPPAGSPRR